jgi:hypothetical protein
MPGGYNRLRHLHCLGDLRSEIRDCVINLERIKEWYDKVTAVKRDRLLSVLQKQEDLIETFGEAREKGSLNIVDA